MAQTGPPHKTMALSAFAVAAIAMFSSAQAAPAATATVDQACYSPGEAVVATGTGFTPGLRISHLVQLADPADNIFLNLLAGPAFEVDAQGGFTRELPAPELFRPEDRTELATSIFGDFTGPSGAMVRWTLSDWKVKISAWREGKANPRGWMAIDTYGWTSAGSTLYAHYYRNLKRVKDVRIGSLTGRCGGLRKRVRQFPFSNVKSGRWTVYFTGTRVHDKQEDPSIRFRLRLP
jgi:hypothetical protein